MGRRLILNNLVSLEPGAQLTVERPGKRVVVV